MRHWLASAASVLLLSVILASLVWLPQPASAGSVSGTSPVIGVYETWGVYLGYGLPGDIVEWNWTAIGNPSFFMVREPGDVVISGLAHSGGFVVQLWGQYYLEWHNYSIVPGPEQVTYYWGAIFTPSLSIAYPKANMNLAYRNTSIHGTSDGYADGILVGLDPLHLSKARMQGADWSADLPGLAEGANTLFVRSYYHLGTNGGNHTICRNVSVRVDTTIPSSNIVSPMNGTSLKSGSVDVYYNCSDPDGLLKVDMKIDDQNWTTVEHGSMAGLGYERLRLGDGDHVLSIRATDYAGRSTTAVSEFSIDSNMLSRDGPYGSWPLLALVIGAGVLGSYAFVALRKGRKPPIEESSAKASSDSPVAP